MDDHQDSKQVTNESREGVKIPFERVDVENFRKITEGVSNPPAIKNYTYCERIKLLKGIPL